MSLRPTSLRAILQAWDGPCRPGPGLPVGPECFGDVGEKDAHRRKPLLPINDAVNCHRLHRTEFREREHGAAIVRRLRARRHLCHGHEVVNQPLDVGLTPAVPALPTRDYVLHLGVEQLQKRDVASIQWCPRSWVTRVRSALAR